MEKIHPSSSSGGLSSATLLLTLIKSGRQWLVDILNLASLEGAKAATSIAAILCFAVGGCILLLSMVLTLNAWVVTLLTQSQVLTIAWSLFVVILANLFGVVILFFLIVQRSKRLSFCATRRQLGIVNTSSTDND